MAITGQNGVHSSIVVSMDSKHTTSGYWKMWSKSTISFLVFSNHYKRVAVCEVRGLLDIITVLHGLVRPAFCLVVRYSGKWDFLALLGSVSRGTVVWQTPVRPSVCLSFNSFFSEAV